MASTLDMTVPWPQQRQAGRKQMVGQCIQSPVSGTIGKARAAATETFTEKKIERKREERGQLERRKNEAERGIRDL